MEAVWDAAELGCARLVLQLRLRVEALQPGDTLRITARDAGAQHDLPAWCRMTGHVLRRCDPPVFVVERGDAEAGSSVRYS